MTTLHKSCVHNGVPALKLSRISREIFCCLYWNIVI